MAIVSIIVPIYNVQAYLPECIESVLAQSFHDYEIILVNDGSPDNCADICEKYSQRDSRIRVIHKENGGLSSARNAGLKVATGKYVFFLDSDDVISPDLLEKTIPVMETGADMVAFKLEYFFPDGHTQSESTMGSCEYRLEDEEARLQFLQQTLLLCKIGWSACTRIFRRDLIEKYNLSFEDNRKIFAEDMHFSLCYCAHVSRIVCISDCLYHYRQRSDSIMGVQVKRSNIGRINELGKAVYRHYAASSDCTLLTAHFEQIHYHIVVGQFLAQMWESGVHPSEFRTMTINSVENWPFLAKQISEVLHNRKMEQIGSKSYDLELKYHAQFLLEGRWTKFRIQCKLIRILRPVLEWLEM